MNIKIPTTITVLALAVLLSGCSAPAVPVPDPAASAATQPETQEPAADVSNPFIKPFGEVVTYDDGVSISVSPGASFTPTEYAVGAESGTPLIFKVVITNNSAEPVQPTAFPSATSAGQMASNIADVGHPEFGDIGMFPTTTLLPGQTIEWYVGFSVTDPADITLEISPTSLSYDMAIFTTAA